MHSTGQNIKSLSSVYFQRQKFSSQMDMVRKSGADEKAAPENGVDLWRPFLERGSWVIRMSGLCEVNCHESENGRICCGSS